jgi:organic radical activating enzyme
VSCSPKTKTIRVKPNWWKILVPAHEDLLAELDLYEGHLLGKDFVYVQPVVVADKNITERNIKRCVTLCINHGFRLSLQTHKFINVP